jgi:hypothetical protein
LEGECEESYQLFTDLSWDSDGYAATFDVYFGIDEEPPLVSPSQVAESFYPGVLDLGQTYY